MVSRTHLKILIVKPNCFISLSEVIFGMFWMNLTLHGIILVFVSAYCSSIRFDLGLRILSKLQFCYYLRAHYNVLLKTITVGRDVLKLPTDVFDTDAGTSMVIDSGTTLAYLADELYNPLLAKVCSHLEKEKLCDVFLRI